MQRTPPGTREENIETVGQKAEREALSVEELVRFFGVLSHDLKSPIFAIDGFGELLTSDYADRLDEEGQDFLRRIRSSSQQMKRILEDMSRMVQLLTRPNAPRPAPLRELIEEVLLKHNYMIEEGGVRVEVAAELPVINVDVEKMREALGAVLGNALFFTDRPKGERSISIGCTTVGGAHRISIRDNGIGIDPRYSPSVFDLGGASKLDRSRGGGPGYGLYLARRVAESHGGNLTVDTAPGEGSTFYLTLPAS